MLDADAEINNSSQKVGGSNAYPDPAPKKVGGSGPRKHIVSTPCVETASPGTIWYCLLVAFLPAQRHASMGTSYGPVSVGLCLSQVGILLKQMNELSCFFVRKLPSTSPALCLNRNSGISKNKGTSLWNSVGNSRLRKFRHGISIIKTCHRLRSTKVRQSKRNKWTIVGQLCWQYLQALTVDRKLITITIKLCLQHNLVAWVY